MRREFLPFYMPMIEQSEVDELIDTLKSGWLTTGPKTKQFESLFKGFIGCNYAVALTSCTAAMHLALVALGIKEGDEVITTPYTFAATAEVIIHAGAKCVFVDVEPDTANIDADRIEAAITEKTKAIIPVHFAGHPCDMEKVLNLAKSYNLHVVEDAAHAIGSEYQNKKIGSIGDVSCFSFYANKNLTTGEGGMATTNSLDLAEKIKLLSLHGISHNAWQRYSMNGSWYYEILDAGYKYNMSDIQASLGIHQLKKFERCQAIRLEYTKLYNELLAEVLEVKVPVIKDKDKIKHSWHLYVIQLQLEKLAIDRGRFISELHRSNIGSSVHFIPLHLHPYYQKNYGFKRGDFPVAEDFYKRAISIPLYPRMTTDDVKDVVEAIKNIIAHAGL